MPRYKDLINADSQELLVLISFEDVANHITSTFATNPYNYFIWLQATLACILIVNLYFYIIPFSVIVICSFM